MEGFPALLNSRARDKMTAPWYRDFARRPPALPFTAAEGRRHRRGEPRRRRRGDARRDGPRSTSTCTSTAGARFRPVRSRRSPRLRLRLPGEVTAPDERPGEADGDPLNDDEADGVLIEAKEGARALLVAGRPAREPIAQ